MRIRKSHRKDEDRKKAYGSLLKKKQQGKTLTRNWTTVKFM